MAKEKTAHINCRITEDQRMYLERMGEGKVSAGLDKVLDAAMGMPSTPPPSVAKPARRAPIAAGNVTLTRVRTVAPAPPVEAPKRSTFVGKRR